jgi:hypothetical protein
MFNISSIFGGGQQPAAAPQPGAQQQAGTTPGNIPPGTGTNNNPPLGTTPAPIEGQNPEGAENKNPLDAFSDLWKNEPNTSGQPAEQNMFNVDPQKLMEAAGKVDFTKVIKPEHLQAIGAGGEGAVQAFGAALNAVAQTVYAQSALATTKIVEQAVNKTNEKFQSDLPGLLKKHNVSDTLRTENPAFSHPAVQPLISALESQMTQKYPNATAKEINDMAKQYLEASFGQLIPAKEAEQTPAKKGAAKDVDWEAFLTPSL